MKLKFNSFLAARFTSTAPLRAALGVSAIALIAAGSANAAPRTWIGNTDANWNTAANWSTALPVTGDNLIFDAAGTSGATLSNNLTTAAFTIAGITFNAPAPAYTISGNAFTLSTGVTNNSAALQTINGAITLSGANSFTAPGGGGIALGAITTASGSSIDVASGTPLSVTSLNGGAASNNRVNVTSAGNLTVTGSFHLNNNVNGAASFTQTAGTITLSSAVDDVASFGGGISLAFRVGATTQNTYALQGGTLNVLNTNLYASNGGAANGLLSITGGTANLLGVGLSGASSTAVGSISLTGGRMNLGANGLVRGATTTGTVTLGAGTVGALADWSSTSAMALSNATTGVTFNTSDANTAAARTISLSGVLSGAGALNTTGTGMLTLSGVNTYTGATTVSAGTLAVNGTLASVSTTVGNTAILQGTGRTAGSVTIQAGGTLAPGNSIESLGSGNLALESGSTIAIELDSLGLNGDLAYSSGTLTIASGSILTLFESSAGTLANGSKLSLISSTGAWNGGLFNYLGNTLADDSTFTLGSNQWLFNYNDTAGGSNFTSDQAGATNFVTMTVVPEPNIAALLGGAGTLFLLRRRRRHL